MTKRIIILRHGERSDLAPAARKIPYEISHDPPLTALGHLEAEEASNYIISLIQGEKSIKLVSSPMLRCVQTISKLGKLLSQPVYLQKGFIEAFPEERPDLLDNLYIKNKPNDFPVDIELIEEDSVYEPRPPETLDQCIDRMKVVSDLYFPTNTSEVLVVCTHLYPIWGVTKWLGHDFDQANTSYTQISELEYINGSYKLVFQGYSGHLNKLYFSY
jgi:broad specificity phosphatase PhoE